MSAIPARPFLPNNDWKRELRLSLRSADRLRDELGLAAAPDASCDGDHGFPVKVPMAYASRIRRGREDDPLLLQVLPRPEEARDVQGFVPDPVGDLNAMAVPGVIHKYHGRALLIASGSCAIHCRYCFRRHFPYSGAIAARHGWRDALNYIRNHGDITEVILSGGDPLTLDTPRLAELTEGLAEIDHVRRLRIHSRMPVVLPGRIDEALLTWLQELPITPVVVIHANHAQEFDSTVRAALNQLGSSGVRLFNQAVLLREVNDCVNAQMELAETAFESGVTPYYLHLLDRVDGASHFEVSGRCARQLGEALRRKLPGYLLPRLVREQAGAPYKLPVL